MTTPLERLQNINTTFSTTEYKSRHEKNENIYIISSYNYASQGIFKLSTSDNLNIILDTYNKLTYEGNVIHHLTNIGNTIRIIKTFKVNNAYTSEKHIVEKFKGILMQGEKDLFKCTYELLEKLIQPIVDGEESYDDFINYDLVVDYKIKPINRTPYHWMYGIDTDLFEKDEEDAHTKKYQLVEYRHGCRLIFKLVMPNDNYNKYDILQEFEATLSTKKQRDNLIEQCRMKYSITY